MIALVVALAVTAGVIIVTYGSQWIQSLSAILPARNTQASAWMMALAICLGASWLMERWQRHGRQ
jgi:Kef-type K+ transport system membrane component KefB